MRSSPRYLKNASNFELIRRINAGECAVQNKNEDEQVESSDISESSDYESNLSEVEKLDSDLPKHYHREIEQGNFSLTTSDASLQEISRIPRSSSLFLPNTSELHMNNCQQSSSVSQDNQEFFPFPSLQARKKIYTLLWGAIIRGGLLFKQIRYSEKPPSY